MNIIVINNLKLENPKNITHTHYVLVNGKMGVKTKRLKSKEASKLENKNKNSFCGKKRIPCDPSLYLCSLNLKKEKEKAKWKEKGHPVSGKARRSWVPIPNPFRWTFVFKAVKRSTLPHWLWAVSPILPSPLIQRLITTLLTFAAQHHQFHHWFTRYPVPHHHKLKLVNASLSFSLLMPTWNAIIGPCL